MKRRAFIKTIGASAVLPLVNFADQFKVSQFENFYVDEPHTIDEYKEFFKYCDLNSTTYKPFVYKTKDTVCYHEQAREAEGFSIEKQLGGIPPKNPSAVLFFLQCKKLTYEQHKEDINFLHRCKPPIKVANSSYDNLYSPGQVILSVLCLEKICIKLKHV